MLSTLPVHWPVWVWASCDEPSLEAKDAFSICEGAAAYSLFARQFVASVAMLAADRAPPSLTACWNNRRQLERAPWNCSGLLGSTLSPGKMPLSALVTSPAGKQLEEDAGPSCSTSSSDKDTEPSDHHSRSETSPCDTCEASGRRACLFFRCLPAPLFFLFLVAV